MRNSGLAIGFSSGLILALAFVGLAAALGPSFQHIDLGSAAGSSTAPVVGAAQTDQGSTSVNVSPPSIITHPFSSLDALSSDGSSLALLFVPLIVGIAAGALLYLVAARRVDAE